MRTCFNITRLHSSSMRTARLLPVFPSMHCAGGVSAPVGGGGVLVSQHALRQTPHVNRMTDRCKNITLPQTSFAGGNNNEYNCDQENLKRHY